MIIGVGLFGGASFAQTNNSTSRDWTEVCKKKTVWVDLKVEPATIKRCK